MIHIKDTIVHFDIFHECFICDLEKCKGICCVEGDWGAPIEPEELSEISKNIDGAKKYMTKKGLDILDSKGFHETDPDGDIVTQCIDGEDCLFAYKGENGIYKCAIETAYENGESDFKKPISCHLYPIRLSKLKDLEALNYSRWDICSTACTLGEKKQVEIYKFLKDPLIRKYGDSWYKELKEVAKIVDEELDKEFLK